MKIVRPASNSGFTLIEIIVAIGVLTIFIGVIYSTFFGTIRAIRTTEALSDSFQPARIVLEKIARDLKGSVHVTNDPRYVFNGIDSYGDDPNLDRIDFITIANTISDDAAPQSDLAEISYYIDPDYIREGYLVRRTDVYPDKEPDKGGDLKIIAEGITGLNFKYFLVEKQTDDAALSDVEKEEQKKTAWELLEDEENWHDDWDWKKRNFMPILVKIDLSLLGNDGNETTFSTVVFINRDPSTVSAAMQAAQAAEATEGATVDEDTETDETKRGMDTGRGAGRRGERENGDGDGDGSPRIDKPVLQKGNIKPQ